MEYAAQPIRYRIRPIQDRLRSVLASFYLMLNLPAATWIRFVVWMAAGVVVYFTYGARRSRLRTDPNYSRAADKAARDSRSA